MEKLNLKDVSAFNRVDTKNTEDEAVNAFGHVTVKEEWETCENDVDESITIVKHEVEDYSSESVELVYPENKVLETKEELEKGKVKCQICSKCFKNRSRLETHMLCHTEERPFKCALCSKGFKSKFQLKDHVKIHLGIKKSRPYVCKLCGKGNLDGYLLRMHMISHTGEKPFRCEICDMRFSRKPSVAVHVRAIHSGERPYECETCRKKFKSLGSLNDHKLMHSDVKDFECGYCKKRFPRKHALRRHILIHMQERPFTCHICKKGFSCKNYVKKHIITQHWMTTSTCSPQNTLPQVSCGDIKRETQEN